MTTLNKPIDILEISSRLVAEAKLAALRGPMPASWPGGARYSQALAEYMIAREDHGAAQRFAYELMQEAV